MQADLPVHGPAHVGFAIPGMLDERSPFDAQREGSSIGATPAAFSWLKTMQLTVMPVERSDAHQAPIIRDGASPDGAMGQHPGIDTVSFPHLCQLLARLLETQLLAQVFRLIPLHKLKRGELSDLLVEPVLAHFQGRETPVPTSLALFGSRRNILAHEYTHRENLAQEPCQSQFPLPSASGRRPNFPFPFLPILAP